MKIQIRVITGVMIFFGYFMIYLVRYNVSVHVVDMVESQRKLLNVIQCYNYSTNVKTLLRKRSGNIFEIMLWSDKRISLLLAAYHIGYCICFPIFHNMGDRYGPTWVAGFAAFISGILNCLTPSSAYYSFWLMFFFRMLIGFCAGAMLPSMVQVIRYWVPPTERHHFMWAYCGLTTGTFCTFIVCAAVQYYYSWSAGFYVSGVLQILWAIVWVFVVADTPQKHSFISQEEKSYLTKAVGTIFTIKLTNMHTPWPLILKSASFWTVCILSFGYAWLIISICLHGPLYYTTILDYNIYEASALTALPFLLRLIFGTISIQTYHWLKNNSSLKRIKHTRKYFIVISHIFPGLLMVPSWFFPIYPGPYLLTSLIAFTSAGMDLTYEICYQLSPNYVNSINTVIKIISNVPGIIIPIGVGLVVHYCSNTILVWKYIWCFHSTVLLLCGLVYLMWGSTDEQPWNDIKNRPPRRELPNIRPFKMSNIPEMEEDDSKHVNSMSYLS